MKGTERNETNGFSNTPLPFLFFSFSSFFSFQFYSFEYNAFRWTSNGRFFPCEIFSAKNLNNGRVGIEVTKDKATRLTMKIEQLKLYVFFLFIVLKFGASLINKTVTPAEIIESWASVFNHLKRCSMISIFFSVFVPFYFNCLNKQSGPKCYRKRKTSEKFMQVAVYSVRQYVFVLCWVRNLIPIK